MVFEVELLRRYLSVKNVISTHLNPYWYGFAVLKATMTEPVSRIPYEAHKRVSNWKAKLLAKISFQRIKILRRTALGGTLFRLHNCGCDSAHSSVSAPLVSRRRSRRRRRRRRRRSTTPRTNRSRPLTRTLTLTQSPPKSPTQKKPVLLQSKRTPTCRRFPTARPLSRFYRRRRRAREGSGPASGGGRSAP
jgi:hypothetical protein